MAAAIPIITAIAGIAGTGFGIMQGQKASKQQDEAIAAQQTSNAQIRADAQQTKTQNQLEIGKANQKSPNVKAILENATAIGADKTLLTGATGIDPSSLTLGKMATLGV